MSRDTRCDLGSSGLGSDGRLTSVVVGFRAVGVRVVAVDVGSVGPPPRFAWMALDAYGSQPAAGGVDPGSAVDATVTTQPETWLGGQARLLLAEAFVSGGGKPMPVEDVSPHAADAAAAAREFLDRLRTGMLATDVGCDPHSAVNLLAATAIWARLPIAEHELRRDILVLKLQPVLDAR